MQLSYAQIPRRQVNQMNLEQYAADLLPLFDELVDESLAQ